jgi:hypothetical protein
MTQICGKLQVSRYLATYQVAPDPHQTEGPKRIHDLKVYAFYLFDDKTNK